MTMMVEKRRLEGVELLRVVAMLFICMHHATMHSGLYGHVSAHREQMLDFVVVTLFNLLVYTGVNIFGLVSGYVGVASMGGLTWGRLWRYWSQVAFFSVGYWVVSLLVLGKAFNRNEMLGAVMPLSANVYWYASSYVVVLLARPLLDGCLTQLEQGRIRQVLQAFFVAFVCWGMAPMNSFWTSGYSASWLIYLYLLGGYMRLYGLRSLLPERCAVWLPSCLNSVWAKVGGVYLGSLLLIYGLRGASIMLSRALKMPGLSLYQLQYYCSPLMLLAAIAMVSALARMELSGRWKGRICWVGSLTFGIYLFHDHAIFREEIWRRCLDGLLSVPWWGKPLALMLLGLGAFALGMAGEWLRQRLFAACARLWTRLRA